MERQWGLDVLRIISMAAVVVIHTASQYWYTSDVHLIQWNTMNFYDSAARWAVPVFVMISGTLFLNPKKDYPIKKMYAKYILRIALIIVFWGLFYSAWGIVARGGSASLKQFLRAWLFGHYHMWFLFMLLGLYIVTPILRCIAKNEIVTKYFLILGFILNIVVPSAASLVQSSTVGDFFNMMEFRIPIGYSFYFVLGYWLNRRTFDRKTRFMAVILGIVGVLLVAGLTAAASMGAKKPIGTFYGYFQFPVMMESVAVFILLKDINVERAKLQKVVGILSGASLGIYLLHPFILETLQKVGVDSMMFAPVLAIPVVVLCVVVISFTITILLRKISVFNKYFI